MVGAASGRVDEIDKVIAEYRNQIYQLQKHNKEIEQGIDVAALTTDFQEEAVEPVKRENRLRLPACRCPRKSTADYRKTPSANYDGRTRQTKGFG